MNYIRLLLSFVVGLAIVMIVMPKMIPFLHKLKFGQYIRELGPKDHQKKAGTPVMGGLMIIGAFLLAFLIVSFLSHKSVASVWIIAAMTFISLHVTWFWFYWLY